MRNNFCRLIEPELKKLDADVPLDLMGMLWSPFHMNERNGYIHVPVESFQEITNFLTDHAQHLAATRQQQAAQGAVHQRLAEAEKRPAVNAEALQVVLSALCGPMHHIRELQVCRGLPGSPIDQLQRDYNDWIESAKSGASPGCADGEKVDDAGRHREETP